MNIEELRALCKALPHTIEDVKWGNDLCFCVAEKMYCVTGTSDQFGTSFKCSPEEFEALCARPGIKPAPYLARYHWVHVDSPEALSDEEWIVFIKKSYHLVTSKFSGKLKRELGIA